MINSHQIIDSPLPADRNFDSLKSTGIDYLLQLSGNDWTNFNESDPGVTILDQLCYALTELGYCQSFPIEDILTQANGQIHFDNQFYTPTELLTTTPVTLLDYRKLLIDQLAEVKNVYIDIDTVEIDNEVLLTGGMQVWLLTDNRQDDPNALAPDAVQVQAEQLLNQHRNLSQWFAPPKVLTPINILLTGTFILADGVSSSDMLNQITLALDHFVSPIVCQYGYQALTDEGVTSDHIFDGPLLNNGWIPDSELAADKLTQVSLNAVTGLLGALDGVRSIDNLQMTLAITPLSGQTCIDIDPQGIAFFITDQLILQPSPGAGITSTVDQQLEFDLLTLQQQHAAAKIGATVDLAPDLPSGLYRDINDYYSVQNTFPPDYGIGPESVPFDSSQYRVAQARQLKGYLMVFDQLLANQFSQLAELGQLFSFTGASTVADAPKKPYHGIPWQLFSPTYFSQPLYQVPDVKPLLLGTDMYRYSPSPITTLAEEHDIWQQYQQNPFNRYMLGLRQAMEEDAKRDDRRNRMLDHLLARHGQSAQWLDNIIHTARWYGSTIKTRIIVKSLLLQNYQALSYYRPKAYSNLMADRLGSVGRYRLIADGFKHLAEFGVRPGTLNRFVNIGSRSRKKLIQMIDRNSDIGQLKAGWDKDKIKRFNRTCLVFEDGNQQALLGADTLYSDGQLNLDALAADLGFDAADFNQYATVEMQLNLLLGLKQHYQWLGQILVALINCELFADWIDGDGAEPFILPDNDLSITVTRSKQGRGSVDEVFFSTQSMLKLGSTHKGLHPDLACYQHHLDQLQWLAHQRQGGLLLEPVLWLARVNKQQPGALTEADLQKMGSTESDCYLRTFYVLPGYVSLFNQPAFVHTFDQLVAAYWAIPIENVDICFDFRYMRLLINMYIAWHNGQRQSAKEGSRAYLKQAEAPKIMAKLLLKYAKPNTKPNTSGAAT